MITVFLLWWLLGIIGYLTATKLEFGYVIFGELLLALVFGIFGPIVFLICIPALLDRLMKTDLFNKKIL